jgi:hypothetical protein
LVTGSWNLCYLKKRELGKLPTLQIWDQKEEIEKYGVILCSSILVFEKIIKEV